MKFSSIFWKERFGKGSPRFIECLWVRSSAGRGKDGRLRLFSRLNEMFSTAGAGARETRPGRLGAFFFCPAAPKRFGRAAWRVSPQSGRSMVEMLAVLAIIGVLSITALVGFTYAMNKHRANTIYNDVHLLALHVMDTGKDIVPADFYPDSGKTFTLDTTTYADGFVVKVAAVSEKVCDRIMDVNDPSIEKIYVGSEETTSCSGTQDIGFMFLYDGTLTSGGGASGGSSGGISSGGSTDPVDPCAGIVSIKDCGATDDMLDQNGCLIVQKISCGSGSYCSGQTCEPCPVADTCSGESCCALTGPNDVCGNPTKEIGTISTVTHSDLNSNGCCESTTEESCSLNPITPRMCTPTCEGTCQGDGTCEVKCPLNTYTPDCLPCGMGAISDGTTSTCTCDIESGFTGIWSSDEANPDNNGCIADSSCSSNADCVSGVEFCAFEDAENCLDSGKGKCLKIADYGPKSFSLNVGGITNHWVRSSTYMSWWSAQNWCAAQRLTMATRSTLGCGNIQTGEMCSSSTMKSFINGDIGGWVWLEDFGDSCIAYRVGLFSGQFLTNVRYFTNGVLCR